MKTNKTPLGVMPATVLLLLSGCVSGTMLSSQSVTEIDTNHGTYTLILYGGQNAHDLSSIAVLDRTDDAYTILPYGAAFNYRIVENLSAADAMERGDSFLHNLSSYRATEKRAIYTPDHTVIGYEMRPLFMPLDTGLLGDILDTSYVLQTDNQVMVYVGFRGGYQNQLDSDDTHFPRDH